MSFGMKVGPDMVGLWLWPLAALYVLRIVKGGDPRWWLGAGAAVGVSLESKYSAVFFAAALIAGLALTPQRRVLGSRWFVAGAGGRGRDRAAEFLWQAAARFPDVGAAAQRTKRQEPRRESGALSLSAAAADESLSVADLDRRPRLAVVAIARRAFSDTRTSS